MDMQIGRQVDVIKVLISLDQFCCQNYSTKSVLSIEFDWVLCDERERISFSMATYKI